MMNKQKLRGVDFVNEPLLEHVLTLKGLRNESYEVIGKATGVHRSNLSAYVSSKGASKNMSALKLDAVLSHLGVGKDGILLPTLHCWTPLACELSEVGIARINRLLNINKFTCYHYHPFDDQRSYLVGVSDYGSRLLIVLTHGNLVNRDTIGTLFNSVFSVKSELLDAEFNQLVFHPDKNLFDQVFYWVSQCVVDDFFENNEVQTCS